MVKNKIHPTAIISKESHLEGEVEVGPFCVIEGRVRIGKGTKIFNNVTIKGDTEIGENNTFFSFSVIGSQPQDLKYKGEKSLLVVGNNNIFREFVTVNSGTNGKETVIGDRNLFMAYSHIAHDCKVGNDCVFANNATLGGHVEVEDKVVIGGLSAVHQFVRIGRLAIIGGCSKVVQDVVPFSMCDGHPAKVYGLNSIGLKRAKIPLEHINQLKSVFKIIFYSQLSLPSAFRKIEQEIVSPCGEVKCLLDFLKLTKRGVSR